MCLNLSRDDDDINDVASMAGVNLSEESARILATNSELVGAVTRSCKDEAFLSASMLQHKILEIGATSSYRKIFDFTTMYCFTRANSCSPECGQAKGWSDRAGSRCREHRLSCHSAETAKPSREGLIDRPAKEHDLQGKSTDPVGLAH